MRTLSRYDRQYERRYHATWTVKEGRSPLSLLRDWLCDRNSPGLDAAPRDLLVAALHNVTDRLPRIAAREPTRRHRKHFLWLITWQERIARVLSAEAL